MTDSPVSIRLCAKSPGGLVMADVKGPGVIYRIWTPTPTNDMVEFYFDQEANPRMRGSLYRSFQWQRTSFPLTGGGYRRGWLLFIVGQHKSSLTGNSPPRFGCYLYRGILLAKLRRNLHLPSP